MLRTALKPKWLALLVLVLLVGTAFVQLGRWQLGVARDKAAQEVIAAARSAAPVPVGDVLTPHTPFRGKDSLRPVTVTGSYAADGQFLVPDRRLDGVTGFWVVTPFVDAATGARLPVLRGFATAPDGLPAPPAGTLTLAGALAPGEGPPNDPRPLPSGQLGSVDLSILVNTWPGEVYNAFLFLTQERSGDRVLPEPTGTLVRVPVPTSDPGLNWRNAAYALQWWVFAGFALWMWWRMVRQDRLSRA